MVAAMMLPLNLPLLNAFLWAEGGRGSRWLAGFAFLVGYSGVWVVFGMVAFIGDVGLHALAHSSHFLHENGWLILPTAVAVAGAFQLSSAKRRSLQKCHYETSRIIGCPSTWRLSALAQGLQYGKSELACCWGLMLLAIATSHGILMMVVLTAVMLAEKTLPRGDLMAATTGAALVITASALVLMNA